MKSCGAWPIGVCSWSFQSNVPKIAEAMRNMGVEQVHLALAPALAEDEAYYLKAIECEGWKISATMLSFDWEDYSSLESIRRTGGVVPDEHWMRAQDLFVRAATLTRQLNVKYMSLHLGFVDMTDAAAAQKLVERARVLADAAQHAGIVLLLETGQESAEELVEFLEAVDHPAVGLNFDPANLILYNKDNPLTAVRKLTPWIRHVHIKDAVRTKEPGTWGAEVPWGDGEVDAKAFLMALQEVGYRGALAIEREAGSQRAADIALAVKRLTEPR